MESRRAFQGAVAWCPPFCFLSRLSTCPLGVLGFDLCCRSGCWDKVGPDPEWGASLVSDGNCIIRGPYMILIRGGGQSSNKEKWVTSAGLRVQENPELKIPDCIHQTLPTPGLSALLHSWSSATTTGTCRAENSPSEALLFLRWSLGLGASLSVLRLQEMRVSLRTTNGSPAIFWFLSSMLSPSPSLGTPLPLNRAVVLEAPPQ